MEGEGRTLPEKSVVVNECGVNECGGKRVWVRSVGDDEYRVVKRPNQVQKDMRIRVRADPRRETRRDETKREEERDLNLNQ